MLRRISVNANFTKLWFLRYVCGKIIALCISTLGLSICRPTNLPSVVMPGGAYNGGEATPIGQRGQVICCSGR